MLRKCIKENQFHSITSKGSSTFSLKQKHLYNPQRFPSRARTHARTHAINYYYYYYFFFTNLILTARYRKTTDVAALIGTSQCSS